MNQYINVRTDLAYEAMSEREEYQNEQYHQENKYGKVIVHKNICDEQQEKELGKKKGIYYLLDIRNCNINDTDDLRNIEEILANVLKEVLQIEGITSNQRGLLVGLGNVNVTPDSLGPLVIDEVIVTRHLFIIDPNNVSPGISNVCAIAPGVMGNTGIETSDVIQAIIEKIDIDYVIAIDSLAARDITRVNNSIQITNTGISPGSGVGNKRKELSFTSIGKPVIAIGVPTVVDAVTISLDTIDFLMRYFQKKLNDGIKDSDKIVFNEQIDFKNTPLPNEQNQKHLLGEFGILTEDEKRTLLSTILTPNGLNMMVTPKEVDIDIENLSEIISHAIDKALHPIVH